YLIAAGGTVKHPLLVILFHLSAAAAAALMVSIPAKELVAGDAGKGPVFRSCYPEDFYVLILPALRRFSRQFSQKIVFPADLKEIGDNPAELSQLPENGKADLPFVIPFHQGFPAPVHQHRIGTGGLFFPIFIVICLGGDILYHASASSFLFFCSLRLSSD